MSGLPYADAAVRAAVLRWLEVFEGYVREVDYASAAPMFDPNVLAFGTHRDVIPDLAAWIRTQWNNVWPHTADFRFDLAGTSVLASAAGDMAVAVTPWTSTGFHREGARFDRPGRATMVFQREGGVLRAELEIETNARPYPHGVATLDQTCTSSNVLWNQITQAVPNGTQDCVEIGFQRPALWRQRPGTLAYQSINQMDQLSIQPPNMVVDLALFESNANWSVFERVAYNPELAGVAPDMATQASQSAWAPFNFAHDPAKVSFVDGLKAQVPALRTALRRAIDAPAQFVPGIGLTPT